MVKIKVKKLRDDAIVPRYIRDGDAAMDLHSVEDYVLKPGERKLFKTGIAMELPFGHVACIWGRSGIALKRGIVVLGGLIEYTYRGDYGILLLNSGDEDFEVKKGDRIAQVAIQPVFTADVEEVEELGESVRGENAFGSSGGTSV